MRNSLLQRTAILLTCGILAAFALTGCGNNPYPSGESARNVLYQTLSDDPKSLDPSFSYTVDEARVCDLIYPSFYKYHYLRREPFEIVLNIGAQEPVREPFDVTIKDEKGVSKTVKGERYTFTIKNDLRFQDDPCFPNGKGRPITAKDIVYSFKRMADPKVQCPVASFFADKVVGWAEFEKGFEAEGDEARKKNYDREIEGVQVDPNDPYTFRIVLTQPYPQLKYLMAMHFTTPQAREAVEKYGDEYARHPVGSGPYTMTEFKPKQRITLEMNPHRHKDFYPTDGEESDKNEGLLDDAGKELPISEKVVFSIIKETVTAWNLFQQGYLDAAGIGTVNYQQAMTPSGSLSPEMAARGITLRKDVQVNVYYMAFNMKDPVFGGLEPKKQKLRQAISLAVDAQEYVDLLRQGNGKPAQWLIPPSVFGYEPDYKNPYRQFDPNLTKAKQLLAEAGYPNGNDPKTGQKLVLNYDNTATTPAGRQQVGIVQKMIERIGIKVESRSSRPNVFQDKLLKGQHQFITYGWFADYPDPENFVFLLYGPNRKPGPNSADYQNPEYDKLFEQMRAMDDSPERDVIIKKMRDIAVEDCPWIPLYHDVTLAINYDWLKNVKGHPIANDTAMYRRVDAETRARKQREWNRPNFLPLFVLAAVLIGGALPAVSVVRQRTNRKVRREKNGDRTTGGAA
jgi:oligopeptide transport system substrate-binding protein